VAATTGSRYDRAHINQQQVAALESVSYVITFVSWWSHLGHSRRVIATTGAGSLRGISILEARDLP
jgi:hypothetical protein